MARRIAPARGEILELKDGFDTRHMFQWMLCAGFGPPTPPASEKDADRAKCYFERYAAAFNRLCDELLETFPEEAEMGKSMVHCEEHGMCWDDLFDAYKELTPAQQTIVHYGTVSKIADVRTDFLGRHAISIDRKTHTAAQVVVMKRLQTTMKTARF